MYCFLVDKTFTLNLFSRLSIDLPDMALFWNLAFWFLIL